MDHPIDKGYCTTIFDTTNMNCYTCNCELETKLDNYNCVIQDGKIIKSYACSTCNICKTIINKINPNFSQQLSDSINVFGYCQKCEQFKQYDEVMDGVTYKKFNINVSKWKLDGIRKNRCPKLNKNVID